MVHAGIHHAQNKSRKSCICGLQIYAKTQHDISFERTLPTRLAGLNHALERVESGIVTSSFENGVVTSAVSSSDMLGWLSFELVLRIRLTFDVALMAKQRGWVRSGVE